MMPITTIAMLSDAVFPYHRGGKETRIHELSTRLAAAGFDVHIYTMQWWEGESVRCTEGVTFHAICPYLPLYHRGRRSIWQALIFGLASLRLLRCQFDVLEVDQMPYFPLYAGRIVCWLRQKPLVATWHEVWGRSTWTKYLGLLGIIGFLIERLSMHLPDRIIAVSQQTAQRLVYQAGYHRLVYLVPNGIDMALHEAVPPNLDQRSDIVYVGRLIGHKRVDMLLEAVEILMTTRPNIRCLIIGDGPDTALLKQAAQRLGLASAVTFGGHVVSDHAVIALRKASRVFVLPSVREGFGISVIEAMADGLPVVTVDHPENAARWLVSAAAGEVCALNSQALAAAIERVLQRPPADYTWAAQKYDWQTSANYLAGVYAQ